MGGSRRLRGLIIERDKGEQNERDEILREETVRILTEPEGRISDLIEKLAEKRDNRGIKEEHPSKKVPISFSKIPKEPIAEPVSVMRESETRSSSKQVEIEYRRTDKENAKINVPMKLGDIPVYHGEKEPQ